MPYIKCETKRSDKEWYMKVCRTTMMPIRYREQPETGRARNGLA